MPCLPIEVWFSRKKAVKVKKNEKKKVKKKLILLAQNWRFSTSTINVPIGPNFICSRQNIGTTLYFVLAKYQIFKSKGKKSRAEKHWFSPVVAPQKGDNRSGEKSEDAKTCGFLSILLKYGTLVTRIPKNCSKKKCKKETHTPRAELAFSNIDNKRSNRS